MLHAHNPEEIVPLNGQKIDLKENNSLAFFDNIHKAALVITELILVAATASAIYQPIDQAVAEACGSASNYLYWWLIIRASIAVLELSLQGLLYVFCLNTTNRVTWKRIFLYFTRMAYGAAGLTASFMILGNAFCLNTMFHTHVSVRIIILFVACWLFVFYDAVIAGKYYSNHHTQR